MKLMTMTTTNVVSNACLINTNIIDINGKIKNMLEENDYALLSS